MVWYHGDSSLVISGGFSPRKTATRNYYLTTPSLLDKMKSSTDLVVSYFFILIFLRLPPKNLITILIKDATRVETHLQLQLHGRTLLQYRKKEKRIKKYLARGRKKIPRAKVPRRVAKKMK